MVDDEADKPPKPIRMFVAMPGKFGDNAEWKSSDAIKSNVLQLIVDKLKISSGRDVHWSVEKDKDESGDIYRSMFNEAAHADVYVADLTGANPNVYLELGVRWAFKRSVTIPVVQSTKDLQFNVKGSRVFTYSPKTLNLDCDKIVATILEGLRSERCDSPILDATSTVWMEHSELQDLQAEISSLHEEVDRLRSGKAERYLLAAKEKTGLERLEFLEDAVESIPDSVILLTELGVTCRKLEKYERAIKVFELVAGLDKSHAIARRELGVCLSKSGDLETGVTKLKEAARIDASDPETWSNLGGAYRRLATPATDPSHWDETLLAEAYDCYKRAHELDEFSLYAGLNVARTAVTLGGFNRAHFDEAKRMFESQSHLALYMLGNYPDNYWLRFDLADCYSFMGQYESSEREISRALGLVPDEERSAIASTVREPMLDFLQLEIPDSETKDHIATVVEMLRAEID